MAHICLLPRWNSTNSNWYDDV